MKGSCHCGAVTIEVPGRPEYLNQCNCSLCFKLGTLWGYYAADDLTVEGGSRGYVRADSPTGEVAFHFCDTCGATTHGAPTPGHRRDRRGVNMRLFEPEALRGLEVRYGDRRNHDAAVPPRYAREPTLFGDAGPIA